jgi:predicted phosphodiesterase
MASQTQVPIPAQAPAKMSQSRFADLSLFHSAVDEVFAQAQDAQRPAAIHPNLQAVNAVVQRAEAQGQIHANAIALQHSLQNSVAICNNNPATYCASLAWNLGLAKIQNNQELVNRYTAELCNPDAVCSPHWVEAALKYAEFVLSRGVIPYRRWKAIDDFMIEGKLPADGRIGIIGDWGTGQPDARAVLAQMARKKPQVAIHLGDIYYSATQFEVDNYFYKIWSDVFSAPGNTPASYTLSGNHDMFGGGAPYYGLLDRLGQPASYFCLRNDDWQMIALDTGLHDAKPDGTQPTYLEDTEVEWLRDKIENSGGRRTVLLSHHQLFSAFEDICGSAVNPKLYGQLADLLPKVDIWLWGHEHNLVIYKKYQGVLARCIGHGAFPIGADEVPKVKYPDVPVENIQLTGTPFLDHGYVIVDLNGRSATLSYFVSSDENKPIFSETL